MPALSGSDAAALVTLRNYAEGEPLELLRRALALSQPGVVRLADRLQARGLVERHRSASDGRAVGLRLTRSGPPRRRRRPRRPRRGHRRRPRHARRRPAARTGPHARAHARRPDDGRHREPRHLPDVRPRRLRPSRALPGDAGRHRPRLASVRLQRGRHGPLEPRPLHLPAPGDPQVPARRSTRGCARASRPTASRARTRSTSATPVPWAWIEAVQEPALVERLRAGTLSVREQRGLGLPWSAALVERARRTTAGTVAAARRALARGVGMNLGGGTHHAGYDFARGYCLFNDVAVALARVRADGAEAPPGARSSSTATSTRATAPRRPSRPTPRRSRVSLHGARNYPFQRIPSDLDVDLAERDRRPRLPARPRRRARRRAAPRAPRHRLLPRRRRPVRGRPPRAAGADQGRTAGPRRAGRRAPARRRRRRRRRPRRRLRARRRRHRRHQRARPRRVVAAADACVMARRQAPAARRLPRTRVWPRHRGRERHARPAGREPLRLVSGKRTQLDAVQPRVAPSAPRGEAHLPR